ncbi:MAG: YkgJ family cysteine cluster protein [Thermoplasmatota archaeon]
MDQIARLRALGASLDFHECGPCGGQCCRMPWTVFATRRDLTRLLLWLRTSDDPDAREAGTKLAARRGKARLDLAADDLAEFAPLPEWEREMYGEGNLLYPRVVSPDGSVPQLRKEHGACQFLLEDGRCGVHGAKPLMCRLFPFYYEQALTAADAPAPRQGLSKAPTETGRSPFRFIRTVDRGWEGNCPIRRERIEEVGNRAGGALEELFAQFEDDIEDHAHIRRELRKSWPTLG